MNKNNKETDNQVERCGLEAGVDFEILSVLISSPSNSPKSRDQEGKEFS